MGFPLLTFELRRARFGFGESRGCGPCVNIARVAPPANGSAVAVVDFCHPWTPACGPPSITVADVSCSVVALATDSSRWNGASTHGVGLPSVGGHSVWITRQWGATVARGALGGWWAYAAWLGPRDDDDWIDCKLREPDSITSTGGHGACVERWILDGRCRQPSRQNNVEGGFSASNEGSRSGSGLDHLLRRGEVGLLRCGQLLKELLPRFVYCERCSRWEVLKKLV